MEKLDNYIKENPENELIIGETTLGEFFIRPLDWCGVWQGLKLVSGDCLAYFSSIEEAEDNLKRLGYNNRYHMVSLLSNN